MENDPFADVSDDSESDSGPSSVESRISTKCNVAVKLFKNLKIERSIPNNDLIVGLFGLVVFFLSSAATVSIIPDGSF